MVTFDQTADFATVRQAIADSEAFDSTLELWDLSEPGLQMTTQEVKALAGLARAKSRRPAKTAVVVHDDLSFGLTRVYSAHSDEQVGNIRVFRSLTAAQAWLDAMR